MRGFRRFDDDFRLLDDRFRWRFAFLVAMVFTFSSVLSGESGSLSVLEAMREDRRGALQFTETSALLEFLVRFPMFTHYILTYQNRLFQVVVIGGRLWWGG